MTVCGHCHYAYYGKKVSHSTGKGGHQHAYYRCIGTDAYRFVGERICDNTRVRTERLDELVWQQVVELLSDPRRLHREYERRLDGLERNGGASADMTALEKHKRQVVVFRVKPDPGFGSGAGPKEPLNNRPISG
jgi:site-specific DNA recombinase